MSYDKGKTIIDETKDNNLNDHYFKTLDPIGSILFMTGSLLLYLCHRKSKKLVNNINDNINNNNKLNTDQIVKKYTRDYPRRSQRIKNKLY